MYRQLQVGEVIELKTLYSTETLNTIMSKRASITNLEVLFFAFHGSFRLVKGD